MTFKCPYTEQCRAEALREFAAMPELAAIFQERMQCREQDAQRARRCATRLGLTELALPSLGSYVQERRRAQHIPQGRLADETGLDIQSLRDLELNRLDPAQLPRPILDRIAAVLAESADYLAALVRAVPFTPSSRSGPVFARTTPPPDERPDH